MEWLKPGEVPGGLSGYSTVLFCRGLSLLFRKSFVLQLLLEAVAGKPLRPVRMIGCVDTVGLTAIPERCNTFFAVADADAPRVLQALASPFARTQGLERWRAEVAGQFEPGFAQWYPPPS